jgi:anti-sigma regulatory factor (Ser/Thr protein kinase)
VEELVQALLDHVHLSSLTQLIRSGDFESDPASVRGARRFIEACCAEIGIDPTIPVLLTSELASNAVNHAKTPYRVTFVSLYGRPVRVEVRDWSPDLPRPRAAGPDDLGGRGFELIESLAEGWHVDPDPANGSKVICFTLKDDSDEHIPDAAPAGQHAA